MAFIKFINPVVTLQTSLRSRVELALCSVKLTPNKTKKFTVTNTNKKRKATIEDVNDTNNGINDELGDYATIQLPTFDISSKKVSYRNETRRVSTSVVKVYCPQTTLRI